MYMMYTMKNGLMAIKSFFFKDMLICPPKLILPVRMKFIKVKRAILLTHFSITRFTNHDDIQFNLQFLALKALAFGGVRRNGLSIL